MELFNNLNYLAIVVSAVVYFAIGSLWYGPLFGERWVKEVGIKMDEEAPMPLAPMFGQAITTIIFTFGMALLIQLINKTGLIPGIAAALGVIVFFLLPVKGTTWFFEGKRGLFLIDFGYYSAGTLVIGIILGLWR